MGMFDNPLDFFGGVGLSFLDLFGLDLSGFGGPTFLGVGELQKRGLDQQAEFLDLFNTQLGNLTDFTQGLPESLDFSNAFQTGQATTDVFNQLFPQGIPNVQLGPTGTQQTLQQSLAALSGGLTGSTEALGGLSSSVGQIVNQYLAGGLGGAALSLQGGLPGDLLRNVDLPEADLSELAASQRAGIAQGSQARVAQQQAALGSAGPGAGGLEGLVDEARALQFAEGATRRGQALQSDAAIRAQESAIEQFNAATQAGAAQQEAVIKAGLAQTGASISSQAGITGANLVAQAQTIQQTGIAELVGRYGLAALDPIAQAGTQTFNESVINAQLDRDNIAQLLGSIPFLTGGARDEEAGNLATLQSIMDLFGLTASTLGAGIQGTLGLGGVLSSSGQFALPVPVFSSLLSFLNPGRNATEFPETRNTIGGLGFTFGGGTK